MHIEGRARAGKDLGSPDQNGDQVETRLEVNEVSMRRMRGRFASGVTVVTTALDGRLRGVTVSAFMSLSLDPPLILIALAQDSTTHEMIAESHILAVNNFCRSVLPLAPRL